MVAKNADYQDQEPSNEKKNKSLIDRVISSDAILLAFASFSAYAILFMFQFGRFSYFSLPPQYISFSIAEIGSAIFFFSCNVLLIWAISRLLRLTFIVNLTGFMFLIWLISLYANFDNAILFMFYLCLPPLIMIIINFMPSILIFLVSNEVNAALKEEYEDYKEYMESEESGEYLEYKEFVDKYYMEFYKNFTKQRFIPYYFKRLKNEINNPTKVKKYNEDFFKYFPFPKLMVALLFSLLLATISFFIGRIDARDEKNYQVLKVIPECVVLYSTLDRVICSPFDRYQKELEPRIKFYYLADYQGVELQREQLGPLTLKERSVEVVITATPTLTPIPSSTPLPTFTPTSTQTAIPVKDR